MLRGPSDEFGLHVWALRVEKGAGTASASQQGAPIPKPERFSVDHWCL